MGMSKTRQIYCCACRGKVAARLTTGREVYPHRPDLHALPFWRHDACGCFVGCHHKTADRTRPLGCIPTPELKEARRHIHALLDPIWQGGRMTRSAIYSAISAEVGWKYHTASLRSIEEAREVYRVIRRLSAQA